MGYTLEHVKKFVVVDPETQCWNWTRSTSDGYGQFVEKCNGVKRSYRVHRFVYEQTYGSLADGLIVRHLCHNKLCCNPAHLEAGTKKENYYDSLAVHKAVAEKRKGILPTNCIPVTINGVQYVSISEACRTLGIAHNTAKKLSGL